MESAHAPFSANAHGRAVKSSISQYILLRKFFISAGNGTLIKLCLGEFLVTV